MFDPTISIDCHEHSLIDELVPILRVTRLFTNPDFIIGSFMYDKVPLKVHDAFVPLTQSLVSVHEEKVPTTELRPDASIDPSAPVILLNKEPAYIVTPTTINK